MEEKQPFVVVGEMLQAFNDLYHRAKGTKMCQICHANYVKGQNHDEDCPVGRIAALMLEKAGSDTNG